MSYKPTTNRQHSKVMKVILSSRKSSDTIIILDESFYKKCGFSWIKVDACLNYLANSNFINLFPNHIGKYSAAEILQASYSYFPDKRNDNFRFFIPTIISIIALIGGYRKELTWLIQAIMKLLK